jgi:superfamily II DNA or RNA helicase
MGLRKQTQKYSTGNNTFKADPYDNARPQRRSESVADIALGISRSGRIVIRQLYNILRVPVPDGEVLAAMSRLLSYTLVRYRPEEGESKYEDISCYTLTEIGGKMFLICAAGIVEDLQELLSKIGYTVELMSLAVPSAKLLEKMVPDKARVAKAFGSGVPREWQEQFLDIIVKNRCGQIQTSTGSGKSTAINAIIYALPKARILYTTPGRAALLQQYANCSELVPNVQLVESAKDASIQSRVMFCSTGMLHHIVDRQYVFDYAFVDEQHSCCTLRLIQPLIALQSHKVFALSANYKQRIDGADKWSSVVFGPLRLNVSYAENVEANNVVPLEVRWRSTAHIRHREYSTAYRRMREGIIYNEARNELIVEDALRHTDDQVLIMVSRTEHALILSRMLHCPAVYGPLPTDREMELKDKGLLNNTDPAMTKDILQAMTRSFAAGIIPLAVSTGVWGQAVDFRRLGILIRAEAQSSQIRSTQIAGRTSRIFNNKVKGIIYDYDDVFEDNLAQKAEERKRTYAKEGFTQIRYTPGSELT